MSLTRNDLLLTDEEIPMTEEVHSDKDPFDHITKLNYWRVYDIQALKEVYLNHILKTLVDEYRARAKTENQSVHGLGWAEGFSSYDTVADELEALIEETK